MKEKIENHKESAVLIQLNKKHTKDEIAEYIKKRVKLISNDKELQKILMEYVNHQNF